MADRTARTLLEQRIRERCLTFEEFVQHAETFARDNHEPGTLSLRHLQRLVSGQQLDVFRRLDRQLGAVVVHDELNAKIRQVQRLAAHSLAPETRELLAALLSEMHTLAGWQALDLGDAKTSWQQYEHARSAAAQSHSIPRESCAVGGQAFALIDAGATRDAVDLLDGARRRAATVAPRRLRAFLAAAHGDALAAHGDLTASLRAFDRAANLLPSDPTDERLYVALDPVHLAHWRGSALALFGHPDAITVLTDAHAANGDRDVARIHAIHATQLATQVGSGRLHRRSTTLLATLC